MAQGSGDEGDARARAEGQALVQAYSCEGLAPEVLLPVSQAVERSAFDRYWLKIGIYVPESQSPAWPAPGGSSAPAESPAHPAPGGTAAPANTQSLPAAVVMDFQGRMPDQNWVHFRSVLVPQARLERAVEVGPSRSPGLRVRFSVKEASREGASSDSEKKITLEFRELGPDAPLSQGWLRIDWHEWEMECKRYPVTF